MEWAPKSKEARIKILAQVNTKDFSKKLFIKVYFIKYITNKSKVEIKFLLIVSRQNLYCCSLKPESYSLFPYY